MIDKYKVGDYRKQRYLVVNEFSPFSFIKYPYSSVFQRLVLGVGSLCQFFNGIVANIEETGSRLLISEVFFDAVNG